MIRRLVVFAAGAAFGVTMTGCPYSFTGASVPTHLKTIAIPLFDDQSGFGVAGLRERFSAEVNDLFVRDNSLIVTDRSTADCMLEGAIVTVTDNPAVISQGEQVNRRQVTLTVRVTFQDLKLRKKVWEKPFSEWGQYESGGGASQQSAGLDEAMKKVAEDILLETVSGW